MAFLPIARYTLLFPIAAWVVSLFLYAQSNSTAGFSTRTTSVLLLTAHPDDECMFFAPTILALVREAVPVYSLCLSTGNADGLGETRAIELKESLSVLGIPPERSQIVDHPSLQDNFTQEWDPEIIAGVVKPYIIAHNITTILTFDERGISQHPNHISLPRGVAHLLGNPPAPQIYLYTLKTVPLLSKYMGPFSHPLTKATYTMPWLRPEGPSFVGDITDYCSALFAMYRHQSQLVWFRWLYVLFSRYLWVNEWAEVKITGV
ncbi:carbohydrate esterase family 14 protein [Hysterangium stoloniferum]|nr:carbohydrate esterase family 14 protein [Hysterangium stoloniferum]